ncbi:unnamed protein product [Blumeria hordei]|uniref:Mediator of RNA polymerase II transcription subunit 13 n=1 Tax=Blumeria hordei TaxID=2867405 RepID=A0A383V2A2_BLUHO|nr:unnamed protein product [Blumeria hordei]
MEPGEYLTNVISHNNLTSISYEYFVPLFPVSNILKIKLQNLELLWRKTGKLVYYDHVRVQIWVFLSSPSTQECELQYSDSSTSSSTQNLDEIGEFGHLHKKSGTYEPATLAMNASMSSINSPINSLSSTSLESPSKNLQASSSRTSLASLTIHSPRKILSRISETKGTEVNSDNVSREEIHQYFISAVLESMMYFLCRDGGFIPFNSRTLISTIRQPIPCLENSNMVEFTTLDISLTSMGTIMLKAHFNVAQRLRGIKNLLKDSNEPDLLQSGDHLWLAPCGNSAKYYGTLACDNVETFGLVLDGKRHILDTISKNIVKVWQVRFLEWLKYRGMDSIAIESGGWVLIQILTGHSPYANIELEKIPILVDSGAVPWPLILCFRNLTQDKTGNLNKSLDAVQCYDPIKFAEEWYSSQERVKIVNQRQKERHGAEVSSKERTNPELPTSRYHKKSMEAVRKESSTGNIYPTPPDALLPPTVITPSLEETECTPENANSCAPIEPDDVGPNINNDTHFSSESWVSASKKDQNPSINFSENLSENDIIFTDHGGDMFGTDITDADFNFFDEPDIEIEHTNKQTPISNFQATIKEMGETQTSENAVAEDCQLTISDKNTVQAVIYNEAQENINSDKSESLQEKPLNLLVATASQISQSQPSTSANLQHVNARSPFSKEIIFNRLKIEQLPIRSESLRRLSIFDRIDFEPSILSINKKYGPSGRYNIIPEVRKPSILEPSSLPRLDVLARKKNIRVEHKHIETDQDPWVKFYKEITNASVSQETKDNSTDLDHRATTPEEDGSISNTEPEIFFGTSKKRKWEETEGDTISPSENIIRGYAQAASPQSINDPTVFLFEPYQVGWPHESHFILPEPTARSDELTDIELIETTQILADQALSGRFQLPGVPKHDFFPDFQNRISVKKKLHCITAAAQKIFCNATICTLRDFLDVQGIPISNQVLRLPPRPNTNQKGFPGTNVRSNDLFPIDSPHLEVRRADAGISVLPSAIGFWEIFGLGPFSGVKNVRAVCVHPNFDGLAASSNTLLDRMRGFYESARFGSHDRIISPDIDNGLIPFTIKTSQPNYSRLSALKEMTENLSRTLSRLTIQNINLVVYFVYPPNDGDLLVQICAAFHHLFSMYRKSLIESKVAPVNEIVLQLIPLDFIASPTSLAVPRPSEYFGLALEVYDRCINFESSTMPAITLEPPLLKSIDFKLTSNPSPSLLHENSCLHIAYAKSIDNRWITAAWIDNRGIQQMTASYCLGRKNKTITTTFAEVANEIWETTLDFISDQKIQWRLIIARVGIMDLSETEFWTGLAAAETNAKISLTLVTVKTNVSLEIIPSCISLLSNEAMGIKKSAPIFKIQGSQSSCGIPENTTTTVDAASEPDLNARLIDLTDQTWGAVLSHRVNNSNSLEELNLALVSGYLFKRGGTNPEDPPVPMEVNVIFSEVNGNPRTFHENLLKEILGYYRCLGTLARVRRVVDVNKDIRPWHIAAVEKAVEALYMLM